MWLNVVVVDGDGISACSGVGFQAVTEILTTPMVSTENRQKSSE